MKPVPTTFGTNRRTLIKVGMAAGVATSLSPVSRAFAQDTGTVTDNDYPPENEPENRTGTDETIEAFEAENPEIKVDSQELRWDPETFPARLAAGDLPDAFKLPYTEPQGIISRGRAADITEYLSKWEGFESFTDTALNVVSDADGKIYGIPQMGYLMGLFFNREHFTEADLDPDSPPATWDDFREAAKKLKDAGHVAFAETSVDNQGGWHFTTWMYSAGGTLEEEVDGKWQATFGSETGVSVLEFLKAMRYEDGTMTEEQLMNQEKTGELLATGQVSMAVMAPDFLYTLHDKFPDVDKQQFGMGILPQNGGNATLAGGSVWMFNPNSSPEVLDAAVKWILFKEYNLDRMEDAVKRDSEAGRPIGIPTTPLFEGDFQARMDEIRSQYVNIPIENYASFVDGAVNLELKPEPPVETQQLYAAIDPVMQAVLTDESADPKQLLEDAQTQFQTQILDQQ